MKFVLIIMIKHYITSIYGFTSKDSCEVAGRLATKEPTMIYSKYTCIEVK